MLKLTSKEFEAIQKVASIETRFIDLIKKIKYIKTNSNVYSIHEQLKIQKKIYLELKDIFTDFKDNETSFRSTISLFSTSVEIENDLLQLYKFILQSMPVIDKILILIEEILTHKEEPSGMTGLLEKKSTGSQLLWKKKNYFENLLIDGIKKYVLPYEQSEVNIIKSQLLSSMFIEEIKEIKEVSKQKSINSFIPIKNLALIGVFATFMWAQTAHAISRQFQEKIDFIRSYNNIENITKIPTGKEILVPQELLKEEFRNLDSSKYKTNEDGLKCFVVKLPEGKGLYSIVRDNINLEYSLIELGSEKAFESDSTYIEDSKDIETGIKIVKEIPRSIPKAEARKLTKALRWENHVLKHSRRTGVPADILMGLMMRESGGNPVALNGTDDAGAGLFQFQPGTAKHYGLNVLDNCKSTGVDKAHGKKLKALVKKHKYNYGELAKIDDRFHPDKITGAAANYLKDLYKKYNDWDKALSAYNAGRPVRNYASTPHVTTTKKYAKYYRMYLEHNKLLANK